MKEKQKRTSVSSKLTVGAFALLVLALAFNAMLNMSYLEKIYVESIVSKYSLIGNDLQRGLERSLKFGKNIEKYIGIDKELGEAKKNLERTFPKGEIGIDSDQLSQNPFIADLIKQFAMPDIAMSDITVSVSMPDGLILYSTDENFKDSILPDVVRQNLALLKEENKSSAIDYTKDDTNYYIILPVKKEEVKNPVASIVISFNEKPVNELLKILFKQNLQLILIILVIGFLLFLVLLRIVIPKNPNALKKSKFKISIVMFLVIVLSQFIFTAFNIYTVKSFYLNIAREKTVTLATMLQEDIDYFLSKGLRINKLVKLEVMLSEIIQASPELEHIILYDSNKKPLYAAIGESAVDFSKATDAQINDILRRIILPEETEYNILCKLKDKLKNTESIQSEKFNYSGTLSSVISKKALFEKIKKSAIDSATVLMISILFLVEMLILIFLFIEKKLVGAGQQAVSYGAIRPAVFIFLFGADPSVSFLPLHMGNLYEPIFGLSKEMAMGLPISVEMFFAGISIFIAGAWLDRRGWHEPFFVGLALVCIGTIYSWLALDVMNFILSRGFVGLGYGLAWMASQGFVMAYTDKTNRSHGIAQLVAGIIAGSLCGGAVGAMLAEYLDYNTVFLISAVIVFSVIALTFFFLRDAIRESGKPSKEKQVQPLKTNNVPTGSTIKFIFNRNVAGVLLLSAFPGAIAIVGLLNYFCPVYLNQLGASQSDIGRFYMIYGICLIYIAPSVSKYLDKAMNDKKYIIVSGILAGLGFASFYLFSGMVATAIAILMLGLSSCFATSQRSYILKLDITQELGEGKAIGIFNSVARLGQVLGPVIFGWLMISMGVDKGITYFGIAYILFTLLFLFFVQSDKKITATINN